MADELIPKKFNFDEPPKRQYTRMDRRKSRRPLLFTPARKKKIIAAFRAGATVGLAAGYGGISKDTLKRWLERGQAAGPDSKGPDHSLYVFSEACMEARSMNALGYISIPAEYLKKKKAADEIDVDDAKLAISVAKTLHPEEYGGKVKEVKHDHEVTGTIEHTRIDLSSLSIEKLKQLRDITKQLKQGEGEVIDAEIVDEKK